MTPHTLIVKYTPRQAQSKTAALLDAFRAGITGSSIEELDLCDDAPDTFSPDRLRAYFATHVERRASLSAHATNEDHPGLRNMHRMTAQFKGADIAVVAFPMHNFSMPAPVKGWFDSVMLFGETFEGGAGRYHGLMRGKIAVVPVAAGGVYSAGTGVGPLFGPAWEHALSLAKLEFEFMGYSDIRGLLAEGTVGPKDEAEVRVAVALENARQLANDVYPKRSVNSVIAADRTVS